MPPSSSGEFDLIARYFAPLATAPGAFGLGDDAAVMDLAPGRRLVATADAMVAGVHFPADDPPDLVAGKLLRVNLSDLAAMGARPRGYLLTLALRPSPDADWLAAFSRGLGTDQAAFGISLLGGDMVSTEGPITLSLTALGEVSGDRVLRRNGALVGDVVFVSGTVGDGGLGLAAVRGELADLPEAERSYLVNRYRQPMPRLALGQSLLGIARAAIDLSDGLLADLGHICAGSGVAARLTVEEIPLSPAARAAVAAHPGYWPDLLAMGDDYELIFTVPAAHAAAISSLAAVAGTTATPIGRIEETGAGPAVTVVDAAGAPLSFSRTGFQHYRQ